MLLVEVEVLVLLTEVRSVDLFSSVAADSFEAVSVSAVVPEVLGLLVVVFEPVVVPLAAIEVPVVFSG